MLEFKSFRAMFYRKSMNADKYNFAMVSNFLKFFLQKSRSSRYIRLNQDYSLIAEVKGHMCLYKTSLDM